MSNLNHTPGPWVACHERIGDTVRVSGLNLVARVVCGTYIGQDGTRVITPEEAKANARLIAAAPEMYRVLREAHKQLNIVTEESAHLWRVIDGTWSLIDDLLKKMEEDNADD